MVLNLCCGNKDYGGLNVDFRRTRITHAVADAAHLPFQDAVFERIECYHGIEHMAAHGECATEGLQGILREWVRCLRPGGRLVVEFPDILLLVEQFKDGRVVESDLLFTLYGRARFPGDTHRWGWAASSMSPAFESVGLSDVKAGPGTDYHEGNYNVRVEGTRC